MSLANNAQNPSYFSDCKRYALQPVVIDEIVKIKRCTNELLTMENIIVTVV